VPFSLTRLFRKDVTLVRFEADKLAGTCALKAFGRSSVGFYLWHLLLPGKLDTYIEQLQKIQAAACTKQTTPALGNCRQKASVRQANCSLSEAKAQLKRAIY
jgi:hypothetical protein